MLNFVVALSCEAKPIVKHYQLQKIPDKSPFPIFNAGPVWLIVSGIGSIAAATATGYLAARQGGEQRATWLNIGIAGGLNRDIGAAVLAHSVTDSVSGQRYYPSLVIKPVSTTADLISVPVPENAYHRDNIYDMEAAGFYAAATRFSSNELIHCFKVISDNQHNPAANVNPQQAHALIADRLPVIGALVDELEALSAEFVEDAQISKDFELISSRFHLTVSQQAKLKNQLYQWYALSTSPLLRDLPLEKAKHAKAFMTELQERLDSSPLCFQNN